jgi:hypothetical protein
MRETDERFDPITIRIDTMRIDTSGSTRQDRHVRIDT